MKPTVGILTITNQESGGVHQYTLSLCEALNKYSRKFNFVQITTESFPVIFDRHVLVDQSRSKSILKRTQKIVKLFTGLGPRNLSPIPDVVLNEIELIISPVISLIPFFATKPYIVTIHDFQHMYYPEFFTIAERIARTILYLTGKFANLVVVESNSVKEDVIRFLKLTDEKIKILPSPPPSYISSRKLTDEVALKIKEKYSLPERYLFYPAQFWYHKNHIKLLEALSIIREKFSVEIPLILVGSKKNNFINVMKKINDLRLQDLVRYLGYVSDEELPYLYKLAYALVVPTLFESISIPIWEAFFIGTPVLCSNVCGLPEQVGDAAILFDPNNAEEMADKIYLLWKKDELRYELSRKGKLRVENFTLERYSEEWESLIQMVLSSVR
ncbi:glycosyltransferase family 4 protein [Fervidobacterium sp.]